MSIARLHEQKLVRAQGGGALVSGRPWGSASDTGGRGRSSPPPAPGRPPVAFSPLVPPKTMAGLCNYLPACDKLHFGVLELSGFSFCGILLILGGLTPWMSQGRCRSFWAFKAQKHKEAGGHRAGP